jgi:hypothetical protein
MNRARASVSVIEPIAGVSYVLPVSAVSYILIDYSANLDTTGRYPYIKDVFVMVDSTVLAFAKSLSDNAAASEELRDFVFDKGLSESLVMQDVCVPLLTILRLFTDTYSVSDASLLELGKNFADAITSSDSNTLSFAKVLNETPAIIEALTTTFDGALNDLVGMGDIVNFINGWYRIFDETVSAADNFNRVVIWNPAIADTPIAVDLFANQYEKPFSDGSSIQDSSVQSLEYARSLADNNISLLGLSGALNELPLNSSDINDDFGVERIYLETGKGISESQIADDIFNRVLVWDRLFSDTPITNDISSSSIDKPISDNSSISDSLIYSLDYIKSFSDSSSATDSPALSVSRGNVSDDVSTSDSFNFVKVTSPPFTLNDRLLNDIALNASY